MAYIIFNVAELICEAPIVTNSQYTTSRYTFNVDWISKGDEYYQFDPSTNLELSIEIRETIPNILVYSGVIEPSVPFNATGYKFNVLDYFSGFSNKFTLYLILKLTSDRACNETTTYEFPIDYP